MRKDILKVVHERERSGSDNRNQKFGGKVSISKDEDDLYDKEYGGKHKTTYHFRWGDDSKGKWPKYELLDKLLHKNIGRPWDKVFSELTDTLDKRSKLASDSIKYIMHSVETKTFLEGRKVKCIPRWSFQSYEVDGFYVHPSTGILCFKPEKSRNQRNKEYALNKPITEIKFDGTDEYYALDKESGLWYYGSFAMVPSWNHWGPKEERIFIRKKSCNKKQLEHIASCIETIMKRRKEKLKGK